MAAGAALIVVVDARHHTGSGFLRQVNKIGGTPSFEMLTTDTLPTMDIFPWPEGRNFEGATAWWRHLHQQDENYRLDALLLVALLDPQIESRLVRERDEKLMQLFALSQATQEWLKSLQVSTLSEMAQAVLEWQTSYLTTSERKSPSQPNDQT